MHLTAGVSSFMELLIPRDSLSAGVSLSGENLLETRNGTEGYASLRQSAGFPAAWELPGVGERELHHDDLQWQ